MAALGAISAPADGFEPPSYVPTLQDYKEGMNVSPGLRADESELTDSEAAEELPHRDLSRAEALELLSDTFGAQLQGPAGIFDELEVERFLSDHVAVIAAGDQADPNGVVIGGEDAIEEQDQPTLLDSTIPLRAPDVLGRKEVVDLSLENTDGQLQPANPLTDVSIPIELGDGIELPASGVGIELAGAPEDRSPSTVEQSVAAYPNVAEDTDFVVAPTPKGVETFTQIRSADAPLAQTFNLSLPEGATLTEADVGGAEVSQDGETLVLVHPPTAMDASGASVPVSFEVSGNSLTFTAEPGPEAQFPLLVDPFFEEYVWGSGTNTKISDWIAEGAQRSPYVLATSAQCSTWCQGYLAPNSQGLWVAAWNSAPNSPNNLAGFNYFIPRWLTDWNGVGHSPTSYITQANYFALSFQHRADNNASPYLVGGLWWPEGAQFKTSFWRGGNEANLSLDSQPYIMYGSNIAKQASFELVSSDSHQLSSIRDAWMGWATVELGDPDHPTSATTGTAPGWVNNSPTSVLPFSFTDPGLGVSSINVKDKAGHSWWNSGGCFGIASSPCPRNWASTTAGQPKLTYDPSVMPQGINTLELEASDPLGHFSNVALGEEKAGLTNVQLRVDHTAPAITLSGTMTEQATLGTTRPQYTLKYLAKDGTTESPQSGAVSSEVLVDGKLVSFSAPGCSAGKNCELPGEWTLTSSSYSVGSHSVVVKVKDAAGITAEKPLTINIAKDTTAPQISATNAFYVAPEGWLEQKSYAYNANGSDSGSGLKSLELKIDGSSVKKVTQTCPAGGCSLSLGFGITVNMASYAGGEHPAELIATDGAGNVAKKDWKINVDPKSTIGPAEAADTLESFDDTTPIGTEQSPVTGVVKGIGGESESQLAPSGTNLVTTSAPAPSVIGATVGDGFQVEGAEGEEGATTTIEIQPIGSSSPNEEPTLSAGQLGAIFTDTGPSTDTVLRPVYDGTLSFQSIRDAVAPEDYSWQVSLDDGQTLKAIDGSSAGIYFEDGTLAMLINSHPAHAADGKAIDTSLSVAAPNVVTLNVHHRISGVVYPVVAGAAWEVGYVAVVDLNPKTEPEVQNITLMSINISAPQPVAANDSDGATVSGGGKMIRTWATAGCNEGLPIVGWFKCDAWAQHIRGFFYYNYYQAWYPNRRPVCWPTHATSYGIEEITCDWVGANHQTYRAGAWGPEGPFSLPESYKTHITAQTRFNVTHGAGSLSESWYKAISIAAVGDGRMFGWTHDHICNPAYTSCIQQ
jgi:hypothetical protein